jgi:hypothetical protein
VLVDVPVAARGATVAAALLIAPQPPGRLMTLLSSVTAPLRARARPGIRLAPVTIVIEVMATIVPLNWVPDPSVAELPTFQ